jgi:hypothetical protein
VQIRVTHAGRLDVDENLSASGRRDRDLFNTQRSAEFVNDSSFHKLSHDFSPDGVGVATSMCLTEGARLTWIIRQRPRFSHLPTDALMVGVGRMRNAGNPLLQAGQSAKTPTTLFGLTCSTTNPAAFSTINAPL